MVGSEILELIIKRAKPQNKCRGVMDWTHGGKSYKIKVQQYENFGKTAFRLILEKPKLKRG